VLLMLASWGLAMELPANGLLLREFRHKREIVRKLSPLNQLTTACGCADRILRCGEHIVTGVIPTQEVHMARKIGDRYRCEKCGAVLVYEKACPCPESMPHSEICCGQQMKAVSATATATHK
jgi:hypothetical protein